ncbi:hypothetical protein DERF_006510 [Dermatophagoides farinae]|uniref:Uncharacterized protein n=1 Tax=Dermatophagoides farinae TaxID=6954 RepID=A0A922L773_DERFA|nr:hypothetical protein DERF_006510 [Dermatophagoides farinae]
MKYFMLTTILAAILAIANGQHALSQAGQGQYYTPPTPSTSATLGQAYNLSPQQLSQPIRVYGSAPTAGYSPASAAAASVGQYSQYSAQPQAQYSAQPQAQYSAQPQAQYSAQPQAQYQAQPQVQAASAIPSNYGWQVQHQTLQPQPQPQPQALAAAPAQAPQYASGVAPATNAALQRYAVAAPTTPLHRPASVHYAQIGENLAGDYRFGYRTGDGNSFREESRLPDGTVQGQYGFVDADGKQRVVKYQAGVGGFQVLGGDGAAPAAAVHSAPVARSATPPVAVHQPAAVSLGQYSSPSIPQQHTTTLQLGAGGARFASPVAASASPAVPTQHMTTLQLGPGGAQFASPSAAAAGHQNTLTIRPIAAIAVRAGQSAGPVHQSYGQPAAAVAQPQTWGSHLG